MKRGFTQIPHGIIEASDLTISEKMCWITIRSCEFKNHNGRNKACPAVTSIANTHGVDERQVRRWINSLRRKGYIAVTERPGRTNIYRTLEPWDNDKPEKRKIT